MIHKLALYKVPIVCMQVRVEYIEHL